MLGNIDGAALDRRNIMPGTQRKLGCASTHFMLFPCLVPRPHYSVRPKRFGSRGLSKDVRRFPLSPGIRQQSELTKRNWENAVEAVTRKAISLSYTVVAIFNGRCHHW